MRLSRIGRVKSGESRSIVPHLIPLLLCLEHSWAFLSSTISLLLHPPRTLQSCPHPSKNTPQSAASLPFPTQVMCSSTTNRILYSSKNSPSSLSHSSLILSILSFDAGSPSTTVTDLYLFSFHVLPPSCGPLHTHSACVRECALVTQCLCSYARHCLCFHMCLSALQSLSRLHSALIIS